MVEIFDNASLGAGCYIHQNINIGAYSMIGMNSSIVKHALPFMINVNNKYTNINYKRLNLEQKYINQLEKIFKRIKGKASSSFNKKYLDNLSSLTRKYFEEVVIK